MGKGQSKTWHTSAADFQNEEDCGVSLKGGICTSCGFLFFSYYISGSAPDFTPITNAFRQ